MAELLLCLTANALYADIRRYGGIITDDAGQPLEFATVSLLAPGDSTLIDGTVTDVTGKFAVSGPDTLLILRISALGFEEKTISTDGSAVGEIRMTPASYSLGEVTVKGSRPVAKLKGDGIQVDVTGTGLAVAGTALDVLGKLPFVSRSGYDIEVLGIGEPLIYINGRQVRDPSELDQLASARIKSVDVVTAPGARYASTVNAVIRIKTITPVGEGFSLNDRTTLGYKHYAYLFQQTNLNYRKNGFDIFGLLNYENYRERPRFSNSTTQYFRSGTIIKNSSGDDFAVYPVYQGKIGLNYNSGSHDTGLYYDFSFKPSTSKGSSLTDRFIDNCFSENLNEQSAGKRHNRQHLLNFYYSGDIGQWNLSANFDALWQINDRRNDETEFSSANPMRNFITSNDVINRLLAGNIIANLPVWKGNFRFGTEVSDIFRTDRYTGNADYISDNDIKITEITSALFAETEQSFGPVSASVGLRWEYTDSKYREFGRIKDDSSRKYHNLAPSASISFPVGNVRARVSYMRKTSRPAFEQLSSAVKYIDRYLYESGNPNLRPVYRDYTSAAAQWKNFVLELEYSSTDNYFMWQTMQYPGDDDVSLLTMVNMPRFSAWGAYASYSPTFFNCWHPSFMAGLQVQDFRLTHRDEILKLDKPMGVFRFNNSLHLPGDIWFNVDFSARTSGNSENLYVNSTWQCNMALYKSFAGDSWNLKLQLDDVFDTSRQEFTSYDALSCVSIRKFYDTRDLSLTLRYNFNSARSRYRGRGAANEEKHRF